MKTSFHKKIYPAKAVKVAAEAFAEVAEIHVARDGDYTTVSIESGNPDEDVEYVGEFENFVLGETIAMRGLK
ncbi:MAG TPA: HxsD-like protein [Myxococcota bacterium]|jgi:hypothetical protein|nr:HxsD-like protein [Myxococcota bacterium]HOC99484.1 HxsD-like protein [Myxococcota bacterium]HOH75995.1 HxsD-like protein [Myxococcota bacterium]HPV05335.1 HxsD-like protein [Myxococcota bacterium]